MRDPVELIGINFDKLDLNVSNFINLELNKCRTHNISINLPKSRQVMHNNMHCAGYFDDSIKELSVACGRNLQKWLPVFVHETCHLDQWIEQIEIWNARINGLDPLPMIDAWLLKEVELDPSTKQLAFDCVAAIELDCEQRSVEKIKKYNLPINIPNYIKKSNAYVWSYRLVQETRDWDHAAAHEFPKIWRAMPKHFYNDYSILPTEISEIFYANIEDL